MKFRKILVVLLTFTLCIGMYNVAFAETNGNGESVVLPSQIEAHRKDISYTEALNDIAFTQQTNINSAKDNLNTRSVTWEVWGEKELDTKYHMYKPVGYSKHVKDGVTLSTYHYTRTFLGSENSPRGDSKRVWGTYLVKATGTPCSEEVWMVYTHKVFYGLSD